MIKEVLEDGSIMELVDDSVGMSKEEMKKIKVPEELEKKARGIAKELADKYL